MRLLRQPQYAPFAQHQQVIILVAAMNHVMQDISLNEMDASIGPHHGGIVVHRVEILAGHVVGSAENTLDLPTDRLKEGAGVVQVGSGSPQGGGLQPKRNPGGAQTAGVAS